MRHFKISDLSLCGLKIIVRNKKDDHRGFFSRLFCTEELATAGWTKPISQINQTLTYQQGTIRGLHFQYPPHAEMKLVLCTQGEVWDVVVDVRSNSSTFLHWHAEKLSDKNCKAILIPEGFAHGFQTLTNDVEMFYCHSSSYRAASEYGLNPRDPHLAITWPRNITNISSKDASHPFIDTDFQGVLL